MVNHTWNSLEALDFRHETFVLALPLRTPNSVRQKSLICVDSGKGPRYLIEIVQVLAALSQH
jgi:hypothetical protein